MANLLCRWWRHSMNADSDSSIDLDRMQLQGMVTPTSERSLIAEEFRLVKRPLLDLSVSDSVSGEGKTFCAISPAIELNKTGGESKTMMRSG